MPARPAARSAWLTAAAAVIAVLGTAPASAGSQSSNSSSNCSNGRCTRVQTHETERGGFRQGWTRIERWDERHQGGRPWRGYDRRDDVYDHIPRRPRRGADRDD